MALITLDAFQAPPSSNIPDGAATLRIWYSRNFLDSSGAAVQGGPKYFIAADVTVTAGVPSVSAVSIYSTVDAQDPNPQGIQCFAQFYRGNAAYNQLFTGFGGPTGWIIYNPGSPFVITFEDLALLQQASYPAYQQEWMVTNQEMINYVNTLSPAADASALVKGITKLSVAPVSAADPIAVGTNDPRIPTQNENDALAGTDGAPSAANPYVTDSDPRLEGGQGVTDVTSAPYNTDNTGATSARTGINAAYAAAVTAGTKRVYLPTGIYRITNADIQAGHVFYITDPDVEWFGDGQGKTILRIDDNITPLNNDPLILYVSGEMANVHDFTIEGTLLVSGAYELQGVKVHNAKGSHVHDIEVVNFNNNATAGGAAFNYVSFDSTSYEELSSTTLGETIVAGTRTVTPPSMTNIYPGRQLAIALGVPETIIGRTNGGEFFKGEIKAIVKYDNALSAADVASVSTEMAALSANWWEAGGASGALFAYQPKSAASYAASKTDLTGNGFIATDSAPFPAWNSTDGWVFDGTGQALTNLSSANQKPFTAIVRLEISDYPTGGNSFNYTYLGSGTGGLQAGIAQAHEAIIGRTGTSGIAGSTTDVPLSTDVVLAFTYDGSGNWAAYQDGTAAGTGTENQTFTASSSNEYVIVTDTPTSTEFTAVFAYDHDSADVVKVLGEGEVYATFERNYIHDAYNGAGFIVTGQAGRFLNNRIINVGLNPAKGQHHFYIQMGGNLFEGNWTEGAAYNTPLWQEYLGGTGNRDGTGNRYVNNDFIGLRHFFSSGDQTNLTLPQYPDGYSLQREQIFIGNRFITPVGQIAGISLGARVTFANNYLENSVIDISSGDAQMDSRVIGNTMLFINAPQANWGILGREYCTIADNRIMNFNSTNGIGNEAPITVGNYSNVHHNQIIGGNYAHAIYATSAQTSVNFNQIRGYAAGAITNGRAFGFAGPAADVEISHNYVDGNSQLQKLVNIEAGGANPGTIRFNNNVVKNLSLESGRAIIGQPTTNSGLDFWDNDIPQMASVARASGKLWPAGGNVSTDVNQYELVGLDANNRLTNILTTDTRFFGVFVGPNTFISSGTNDDALCFALYEVGADVTMKSDAAWVKGNVGIVSTDTARRIKDTGAATPREDSAAQITGATIATTATTTEYVVVPKAGTLSGVDITPLVALTADDTNYLTWTITNLGQAGAGTTVMLAATDPNTTKATGGTGLAVNTRRALTPHGTAANLTVAAGDILKIVATATGTLANTVTRPIYSLRFDGGSWVIFLDSSGSAGNAKTRIMKGY